MSALMEYKGADVEQAIAGACSALGVAREALEIQVISTGSAGIFGLGRRQAVVRVRLRPDSGMADESAVGNGATKATVAKATVAKETVAKVMEAKAAAQAERREDTAEQPEPVDQEQAAPAAAAKASAPAPAEAGSRSPVEPLNDAELAAVQSTIARLLELSVGPAAVHLQQDENGGKLLADLQVDGDASRREQLVGPQGQTLEALQYLLRKMVSKQLGKRVALELDAAGFRAERRESLQARARELAAEVKSTGKTRTMAAMGPAERRLVHLALQDDPEVRSRSVGEGVFKKVLVHPPGKGRRRRKR
ncbi:Jag N-terminal domain-containing protein [Desulfurivibrio alkaliphilus]|uniref:RNA-binding protein KhpB n=1 Tax=Desulfurivibrio alkaliphilus (strain DSM 19089 / UNIQEM U267 / AHT2) TaxID=589865 RepID=D6Z0W1_DESAT|nr:Jag N-terminal domain-containing protein [Desulfurivibrio alkaliphilus]ADH87221.1 single-stranded nucleic acid binding R3H domain protein [Desulfurivibrio alkaliphilus AHT 2]